MIHSIFMAIAWYWFITWIFSSSPKRDCDHRPKTEKEIAGDLARAKDRATEREMRRLESCWAKFERDCRKL